MLLFLILAGGIWAIGHFYVCVLAVQIALPDGNPLRVAFGGELGEWVILGVVGGGVWGYSVGLSKLRKRVRPENRTSDTKTKAPAATTERYARHIVLREIGGPGQKRLREAKVLVVGAGGLGSPVLLYLAGAGVGVIGVIDDDVVDLTNLQRQVIHTDERAGMPKVFSAAEAIAALDAIVETRPYHRRLTDATTVRRSGPAGDDAL